ncbi:prepilin-type N-terminal cleavage/methylation domain-containing protein [bacterium]|nr:prepilin-type N-terminal cleavage/methylation domain-containing protein [bacterium]
MSNSSKKRIFKWKGESGFTLLELITVMVIVGIVTGVVSVSVDSVNEDMRLSNAANRALADIRHAQEMAMTHRRQVDVYVVAGQNQYYAKWNDTNAYLDSPTENGHLDVHLNTGEYHGVTMSSGLSGILSFTATGEPLLNGSRIGDTNGRSVMFLNNRIYVTFYRSGLTTIEKTVGGGGCAAAC